MVSAVLGRGVSDTSEWRWASETGAHEALAAVWRALVGAITERTVDIDAERLLDVAVAVGLYEHVLYDPQVHGEDCDAEPGTGERMTRCLVAHG